MFRDNEQGVGEILFVILLVLRVMFNDPKQRYFLLLQAKTKTGSQLLAGLGSPVFFIVFILK